MCWELQNKGDQDSKEPGFNIDSQKKTKVQGGGGQRQGEEVFRKEKKTSGTKNHGSTGDAKNARTERGGGSGGDIDRFVKEKHTSG